MDQSLAVLDQSLKQINRGDKWITHASPRYRGKMAEERLHRMTKASAAAGDQGLDKRLLQRSLDLPQALTCEAK